MAGLLIFVSMVTGFVSFIGLIRPLPRLWLPTRKRAAVVWAASFVLFGVGGALLPDPSPEEQMAQVRGEMERIVEQKKARKQERPEVPAHEIVEVDDISFAGARRLSYRIQLPDVYTEAQALQIARWIVATQHMEKELVNAVGFFYYFPGSDPFDAADGSIHWAPDGDWSKARNVRAGDYWSFRFETQFYKARNDGRSRDKTVNALAIAEKELESNLEAGANVVCDRFELQWELHNSYLLLAIDTDLPDTAQLSVSVRRTFFEVGNNTAYSRDYFGEFEPVSRWRQPRRISLDAAVWKDDLADHQAKMAALGSDFAFEIDRIEEHLEIRAVLHLNQDDPRFGGFRNPNLSGKATSRSGIIEAEASVPFPLEGPPLARRSSRAPWNGLVEGETYRLSKETPLMPKRHPSDPWEDLARVSYLPAGSVIRVVAVDQPESASPWYKVVFIGDGRATGWINSIALMKQEIQKAAASP